MNLYKRRDRSNTTQRHSLPKHQPNIIESQFPLRGFGEGIGLRRLNSHLTAMILVERQGRKIIDHRVFWIYFSKDSEANHNPETNSNGKRSIKNK